MRDRERLRKREKGERREIHRGGEGVTAVAAFSGFFPGICTFFRVEKFSDPPFPGYFKSAFFRVLFRPFPSVSGSGRVKSSVAWSRFFRLVAVAGARNAQRAPALSPYETGISSGELGTTIRKRAKDAFAPVPGLISDQWSYVANDFRVGKLFPGPFSGVLE